MAAPASAQQNQQIEGILGSDSVWGLGWKTLISPITVLSVGEAPTCVPCTRPYYTVHWLWYSARSREQGQSCIVASTACYCQAVYLVLQGWWLVLLQGFARSWPGCEERVGWSLSWSHHCLSHPVTGHHGVVVWSRAASVADYCYTALLPSTTVPASLLHQPACPLHTA